jgi:hypothetical protein
MIGARHAAGSTISKGGDRSPSNWVIVGAVPRIRGSGYLEFCQKNGGFVPAIVGNRSRSAKQKNRRTGSNAACEPKRPGVH